MVTEVSQTKGRMEVGIVDHNNTGMEDWALTLDDNHVHLMLSEHELNASELSESVDNALSVTLNMIELDSPIPSDMLKQARVAVIEVSGDAPASIERIGKLRKAHPDIPVIAAMRDANISVVRGLLKDGVSDVLELPLTYASLSEVLKQVLIDLDRSVTPETAPAKIISVIKSIGGVGATTLAVQTASRLAEKAKSPNDVCLFDMDLQFGSAGSFLGIGQPLNFADLLNAGTRIDGDLLRSVAATLPSGLNVIPAPADIIPMETVNADQIFRIIDTAAGEYETLILDLPGNWTNWSVSLVARSDIVLLVVELTIASLRQAKRQLALLSSQGVSGDHVMVVVNRVEKRLFRTINLEDAERAIGYPVNLSVQNDYPLVSAAHDQGVLIEEIRSKSKISRDIETVLESIEDQLAGGE